MLIQDSASLATFCEALVGAPYIAVDTEFLREKTYYPKLCLVQVAYGEHAAAIDPLVDGIDLGPLGRLLNDDSIVKVFHAAPQDLEIFLKETGQLPVPLFDTQVAAAVCGLGDQPGYAKVVNALLGVTIDKASQATDWTLRPLSERQLEYALGDVTYLCKVYEILQAQLTERGRDAWVAEEMSALANPDKYRNDPLQAYRRIRVRRPKRRVLAALRDLAAWREREAESRDIPRKWLIKDEALVEIAEHGPTTREKLGRVRGLSSSFAKGADGQALLDVVEAAFESPEDMWPPLPTRKPHHDADDSLVALLQALLKVRCDEHSVAARLVATRSDLDAIVCEGDCDIAALKGWRREIFGADALALRAGRLALTGTEAGVSVVSLD